MVTFGAGASTGIRTLVAGARLAAGIAGAFGTSPAVSVAEETSVVPPGADSELLAVGCGETTTTAGWDAGAAGGAAAALVVTVAEGAGAGTSTGRVFVGNVVASAPLLKYAAPGPEVGTLVASAPFVKYCAAAFARAAVCACGLPPGDAGAAAA
jgi:hypothetical protein